MRKHFLELFKYNYWANLRMLRCIEENQDQDHELIKLFSHLISAQIIWLNRIKDLPTTPFPIWEVYKLRELGSMVDESNRNWEDYISQEHPNETFEEMIFYKNSKGEKFETTVRHIITQVITHSTYHRAQMARRMRELGLEPPATDFIAFSRLN